MNSQNHIFQLVVLLSLFSTFLYADESITEMVDIVWQSRVDRQPTPRLSKEFSTLNLVTAYKVQKAYVDRRLANDEVGGYKAGFTSKIVQEIFGIFEPISGVLFKSGRLQEGAIINNSDFGFMLIDQEFGYEIGTRITEPVKNVEELKTKIRNIRPVIEMGDATVPDLKAIGVTITDMVAANVGSMIFIPGEPVEPKAIDLNSLTLVNRRDGEEINRWEGSESTYDQWDDALWLANNLINHGWTLEPGEILLAGARGNAVPGKPGLHTADFGELGSISFEIK
ncbi:MAG: 2-keto-4-pentenoate hydratase [Gammaproteobacteria bacterium]